MSKDGKVVHPDKYHNLGGSLAWQPILKPQSLEWDSVGNRGPFYYRHINQSESWSFSSIAPWHAIVLIATLISERFTASSSKRIIGPLLGRSNPLGSTRLN